MMSTTGIVPPIQPLFFRSRDLLAPSGSAYASIAEICTAAERTTGPKGVFGCQKISGIYHLYPSTVAARTRLAGEGFPFRGQLIKPSTHNFDRTFFHLGAPVEAVRLTISNLPLSVDTGVVLSELERAGFTLLSDLVLELAKDRNGFLTRYKNGNRTVFVIKPTGVTPRTVKVSDSHTAFIFFREREEIENRFPPSETRASPPLDIPVSPDLNLVDPAEISPQSADCAEEGVRPRSDTACSAGGESEGAAREEEDESEGDAEFRQPSGRPRKVRPQSSSPASSTRRRSRPPNKETLDNFVTVGRTPSSKRKAESTAGLGESPKRHHSREYSRDLGVS